VISTPRHTLGRYNPGVTVEDLPDWEHLLAAERHLQSLVSGAVLVGGTAAALPACHRKSLGGNHVLEDLRARFDEVLAELEAATDAFASFDELYAQESGASPLVEVVERLGSAEPSDRGRPHDLQGPRRTVERVVSPLGARATLGEDPGSRPPGRSSTISLPGMKHCDGGFSE
jgi:hypothetical protein